MEMRKTKRVDKREGEKVTEKERSGQKERGEGETTYERMAKERQGYGGEGRRRNDRRKEWSTA